MAVAEKNQALLKEFAQKANGWLTCRATTY